MALYFNIWKTFSQAAITRRNSCEYQASLCLEVCPLSHSCILSLYPSPFHSLSTILLPLPIRSQNIRGTLWEHKVTAGQSKAHCYLTYPSYGGVYPYGPKYRLIYAQQIWEICGHPSYSYACGRKNSPSSRVFFECAFACWTV